MNFSPNRLKMVPLAIAAMLGGLSTGAWAAPQPFGLNITLDANYRLGNVPVAPVLADGMSDTSANLYNQSDNGAGFYLFKSAGVNNVFFHTYGFASSPTYFGARASGEGHFAADTRATFSKSFTNNSGVAQLYNFSFMVDAGEVGVGGLGAGFASLLLSIKKDTIVVAQDFTSITQTATGAVTCADNDTGLAYMSCLNGTVGNALGSGGPFNVSMGLIGAGETFTLDYDIIATVSGELTAGTRTVFEPCGYGGYGDALQDNPQASQTGICEIIVRDAGTAIARSGDPFNGPIFDNNGVLQNAPIAAGLNVAPTTVPEPGSMALIGLGLVAAALARRKKVAKAS